MKKIFFSALLICACLASSAATYNCQNPKTTYTYAGSTYSCGNTTTPGTICYYYGQGQIPAGNTVYGCDTKAPINSGLIFLIIAAAGIGTSVIYKKKRLNWLNFK